MLRSIGDQHKRLMQVLIEAGSHRQSCSPHQPQSGEFTAVFEIVKESLVSRMGPNNLAQANYLSLIRAVKLIHGCIEAIADKNFECLNSAVERWIHDFLIRF